MGKNINAGDDFYRPSISPDVKYIFFQSTRSGDGDIYWVDVDIIEVLQPIDLK